MKIDGKNIIMKIDGKNITKRDSKSQKNLSQF